MDERAGGFAHEVSHRQGVSGWRPTQTDLLGAGSTSRRWFMRAGLSGIAGLSASQLFQLRAEAAIASKSAAKPKSVIFFWLSGGPSHLDMWDPKPDAPSEVRGPFGSIATNVPGVRFCEHLPRQAAIMDKLTVIRSMDCSASNHTPITMQAGNPLAQRTDDNREGGGYPSMGSIVAKLRGSNDPNMPAFVGLADSWKADVWGAGHMGAAFEPVKGSELSGRFELPKGVNLDRLASREALRKQFDQLRSDVDSNSAIEHVDRYTRQAIEMVCSGQAQRAFQLDKEDPKLRDAYGRDSLGTKALLARRLVEAGVSYVMVSGAWGYFDHHGDNVVWKGIEKGLKPLLPRVDQTLATLVADLEGRGLLESTLIVMMGEFGRSPVLNREAGREHWTHVMSMVLAGGGLRHGQVIGATDSKGYGINQRKVTPQDLAATIFTYLGIDPNASWVNPQGRPIPIVVEGGQPIAELF
ncbi:DUF1501 domain-containing protein [Singulisphaera acidiphila]|uniref:DUF1501 domain-containing protein n=1 Tax=Singulisphaera acidiphila (strain ATCC BAA-1392 / DSM 18658 / VKM B-2454 / MOB10) TaxID=886293 RepID=L0D8Q4_SINAD|nr:DUF1501 domain-containing protein [Singulisphaera acidiphila]AGA25779.1 hypothetical protein Sinac_1396 [Singulisphaera acidiphila DSM 18658]